MTISTCTECENSVRVKSAEDDRGIVLCKAKDVVVYIGGVSPIDAESVWASDCTDAIPLGEVSVDLQKPIFYKAVDVGPPPPFSGGTVTNCRGCKHFRAAATTGSAVIPMCGATGGLLTNFEKDADGCPFGAPGIHPEQSTPVALGRWVTDPEAHKAEASAAADAAEASANASAPATVSRGSQRRVWEPSEYHTDAAIAEQHKGIIRAWRAITVGEGTKRKDILLPIFEPEYFSDAERTKIPETGSDEHPELYHDGSGIEEAFAIEAWLNDEPLCFVGEPGTGKTEAGRYIAWMLQTPFTLLSVTEETLFEDFVGRPGYSPTEGTYYHLGPLALAWGRPGVVLTDEFNTGQDAIRQAYRSANTKASVIHLYGADEAEVVCKRHAYAFNLLAINPVWDARNLGTRELADADVSRLTFKWVEEPPDSVISDIIVSTLAADDLTVTRGDLANMLRARKDIKEMSRDGALPFSWSIRQDVKVARKLVHYSPQTAYKRTLLDYVRPDTASAVLSAVSSHFGFTT